MFCRAQNQEELDAALLVDDKKKHLISNLASSWIYGKLVTNVRLSDKITDTKIEYSHLYAVTAGDARCARAAASMPRGVSWSCVVF